MTSLHHPGTEPVQASTPRTLHRGITAVKVRSASCGGGTARRVNGEADVATQAALEALLGAPVSGKTLRYLQLL